MRLGLAILLLSLSLPLLAQDDLPEGKGKETLENTCTECHGLDRILDALRTREHWQKIAVEMRSKGATMTDDELKTLVDYLFQNFGTDEGSEPKPKPEPKINVNKASAKELEAALPFTLAETTAIVRYRVAKGPFRQWQDLTKVDGLDKAKVEANKDRFSF